MTQKSEQIRLNIEELNANLIHKVLTHLDVKWKIVESGDKKVPTVKQIESVAEYCMREAFNSKDGLYSMGGFEAEVIDGIVSIKFILTQANPLSKLLG